MPLAAALLPLLAFAADDPAYVRIGAEGKYRNRVMDTLRELTQGIGPRVTGSPEIERAEAWAIRKFAAQGIPGGKREPWGTIPIGFSRGPGGARILGPGGKAIAYSTAAWSPGTRGPVQGEAILQPTDPAQARGKWVLIPKPTGMRAAALTPEDVKTREALLAAKPLGFVLTSTSDMVWTNGRWSRPDGKPKTMEDAVGVPTVTIVKSAFDDLVGKLQNGGRPRLEFNLDNRWRPGPITVSNVVAEIKGSEKPDEVVIVGAHLDSWNAPGSQGTMDDGTGVASVLEAARLVAQAGRPPKRTIRFILFTGEEQGLLGSTAYVKAHQEEMAKISAVLIEDGGTNYESGAQGIESMRPMMEAAMARTNALFPTMPLVFNATAKMGPGSGTDHVPFRAVGVPGFAMDKAGRANYGTTWHSNLDRYERAIPEYLVQSSTNLALMAMSLADAATMLPREIKTP